MTGTSLGRPWSRVRHGHHQPPAGRSAGRYTAASLAPGGRGGTQAGLAGVARGGALNLVGAAVSAVATIGLTVVVTRHFSKPVAGAFFTAISIFLIVEAVASLGANVGAVNFIARLRSLGQEARIPVILRAAVIPVVVTSLLAAAALLVAAGPLSRMVLSGHLGRSGASPATVSAALRALAIALPFAALLDTFLGATRGYRDMHATVAVDKIGRSTGQLLGVIIGMAAGSVALLAPLWALPYVPASLAAWLWLRRLRRRAVPVNRAAQLGAAAGADTAAEPGTVPAPGRAARPIPDQRLTNISASGFWRFTAPRAVASLAQITIQRIDIVLVAIMRGPAEAAIYTAATRFLVAGQFGNAAISMAAQPRFAELFTVRNRRAANVLYQVTTGWLVLLTWPLYLLAVVYGPQILSLFGHSYRAGGTVMVILGCTMLLATACGQVDMVLITSGRSSWSLANGLMAVAVNVSLDLLLIPKYGITGAAIGWAVAITITNLVPLAQLAATQRLHPFGGGALIAGALATACFAGLPLAARSVFGPGAPASVTAVACGAVSSSPGCGASATACGFP